MAQAEARQVGYAPLEAEAALARGTLLLSLQRNVDAAPVLTEARTIALRERMVPLAVEAAARKIFVEQMEHADPVALERDIAVFEPMSRGIVGDHIAHPLLLNNIGAAYMAAEQPAVAARYFAAAREARPPSLTDNVELMIIESNVAMTTADDAARERVALAAWEGRRALLGDSHLMTLQAGDMYGRFIRDPKRALPIMDSVCARYHHFHPDLRGERVHCEAYRALLLEATGARAAATQTYTDAAAIGATVGEETAWLWTTLAWADARRLAGAADVAAIVAPLITWASTPEQSWRRLHGAHALLSSALARHACGGRELPEAIAAYRDVARTLLLAEPEIRLAVAGREDELVCPDR